MEGGCAGGGWTLGRGVSSSKIEWSSALCAVAKRRILGRRSSRQEMIGIVFCGFGIFGWTRVLCVCVCVWVIRTNVIICRTGRFARTRFVINYRPTQGLSGRSSGGMAQERVRGLPDSGNESSLHALMHSLEIPNFKVEYIYASLGWISTHFNISNIDFNNNRNVYKFLHKY